MDVISVLWNVVMFKVDYLLDIGLLWEKIDIEEYSEY